MYFPPAKAIFRDALLRVPGLWRSPAGEVWLVPDEGARCQNSQAL